MEEYEMNDSWETFFGDLGESRDIQEQQKQQGLNDFTALGSVLKSNDEVRLHTRFIYSLLNPQGKHFQGTRFLELFLECIGRNDWLDIESTIVKKEYCPKEQSEQIDLYITDGQKEIVIENKLNALDQPRQVIRYLDAVDAKNPEQAEDTLFIYLTKDRTEPSPLGLGQGPDDSAEETEQNFKFLTLCGTTSRLLNKEGEAVSQYQNLWYRSDSSSQGIQDWLDSCTEALKNIDAGNLAWAIADYKSVVERATKEYVSNVTTLKDFLEEGIARGEQYHVQAAHLAEELPSIHMSWLDSAMTTHLDELFSDAIEAGAVTKIDHDCAEQLTPFLSRNKAKEPKQMLYAQQFNFFGTGQGSKNRGSFYRLETGPLKGRAVLALFYGSKRLHVGCLLCRDATDDERGLLEPHSLEKPSALRENIFPQAMTRSKPLSSQGINDLADFTSSPQRTLLNQLIDSLAE